MKTDINVVFKVPKQAYEILEMIAEQNNRVSLYCVGGTEILLAGSLLDFQRDIEDDDVWGYEDLPF